MTSFSQLSRIFRTFVLGQKQENDMLDSLLLTYDEALKGGTQAIFADTTSRPRNKFSGGHMDISIGARKFFEIVPVMMRQQTSFNKSIRMAGMPHHVPYVDAPDFVAALPHIASELGAAAAVFLYETRAGDTV